jgi:hypothetical protein
MYWLKIKQYSRKGATFTVRLARDFLYLIMLKPITLSLNALKCIVYLYDSFWIHLLLCIIFGIIKRG